MSEVAQATAPTVEEEDEDILTFSTDDSDGDPEPDTATTEPPAEEEQSERKADPVVNEAAPAEPGANDAPDEERRDQATLQQPSRVAINDDEAIKRRQARFGIEPTKAAATAVRQGAVTKRAGNAFAGAQQSSQLKQASGPERGRGFMAQRGRGVGSFRGRGGRGPMMRTRPPIGGPGMVFAPPEPPIAAPRPPSYPPPMMGGGARTELMGNAFASIKERPPSAKPAKQNPSPHVTQPTGTPKEAPIQNSSLLASAPAFRPRMPSVHQSASAAFGSSSGQIGKPGAAQVAKASTWVRSDAAAVPASLATGMANWARPLETKAVATASTWINPKVKQAGGTTVKAGGATMPNAFAPKQPSARGAQAMASGDKDAEIQALKERLAQLERASKRKAEDCEDMNGGTTVGVGMGASGKRHRQLHTSEPATEASPPAPSGRNRLGILERLQFGPQRCAPEAPNGPSHDGHDARDGGRQQRHKLPGDVRSRQKTRVASPSRQDSRRQEHDASPVKGEFRDNQRRRMDRFAARG